MSISEFHYDGEEAEGKSPRANGRLSSLPSRITAPTCVEKSLKEALTHALGAGPDDAARAWDVWHDRVNRAALKYGELATVHVLNAAQAHAGKSAARPEIEKAMYALHQSHDL